MRFYFSYRGGEIEAEIEAETETEAREKLERALNVEGPAGHDVLVTVLTWHDLL